MQIHRRRLSVVRRLRCDANRRLSELRVPLFALSSYLCRQCAAPVAHGGWFLPVFQAKADDGCFMGSAPTVLLHLPLCLCSIRSQRGHSRDSDRTRKRTSNFQSHVFSAGDLIRGHSDPDVSWIEISVIGPAHLLLGRTGHEVGQLLGK